MAPMRLTHQAHAAQVNPTLGFSYLIHDWSGILKQCLLSVFDVEFYQRREKEIIQTPD